MATEREPIPQKWVVILVIEVTATDPDTAMTEAMRCDDSDIVHKFCFVSNPRE
jgi:hypothetical protein